jgi:DNA-binding protein HU-beta
MAIAKKLNRTQLIEALAVKLGISKTLSEKYLASFIEVITDKLIAGYVVNITGFGVFKVVTRAARMGVNPKTRQPMKINTSTSVGYKVGKTLKEAVRRGKK